MAAVSVLLFGVPVTFFIYFHLDTRVCTGIVNVISISIPESRQTTYDLSQKLGAHIFIFNIFPIFCYSFSLSSLLAAIFVVKSIV